MQYLHLFTNLKSTLGKLSMGLGALLLCTFLVSAFISSNSYGGPVDENKNREQLWQEVKQARSAKLPKTEMALLQRIYDLAINEDAMPDAARALFQKIAAEAAINQPAAPFAIKKLQAEIDKVPDGLKPITDAVLANWMFTYFQNNRWQFQQRSQTATDVGDDFQTWDLRRILAAVDQSLTDALSHEEQLKKIPIKDYAILTKYGDSKVDARRPTVYDFIAHRALEFYALDEQIIEGIDAFYITADSPIFSSDAEFLAWNPVTKDKDSFALKAIRLHQQLLTFHKDDEDRTAYLAADLDRLAYANREAKGPDKDDRYRSALQRFADQHKQHPLSSEALAAIAQSHVGDKKLVEAHRVATIGLNRFKDSLGGKLCHNIIQQIERPAASVTTELIWNEVKPDFAVNYKNLDKIQFRMVKFKPAPGEPFRIHGRGKTQQQCKQELLNMPAATQWDVDLPATEDYQLRTEKIEAPGDLEKGTWLLIGVTRAGADREDVLFAELIQHTDLAHISRANYGNGAGNLLNGQVLNAITGLPVEGAKVKAEARIREGRNWRIVTVGEVVTDKDGLYSIKARANGGNGGQHFLTISDGEDLAYVTGQSYGNYNKRNQTSRSANFFTDRSIYRPGQSVNFKVVCTSSDRKDGQYQVAANKRLTVQFYDGNNQVIESLDLVTNDLGSAAGTFTAPADRGTGWFRLQTSGSPYNGSTGISVEEYKRPKFKVDIDKPEKSFALNDTVKVTGHAMAYNGAAIDGAKVSYRVVRSVRFADWWYWRCWWAPVNLPQKEIGQGKLETKADGSFEVSFDAVPDPDADREGQPMFVYTVYADVTDSAGETRSSNTRVNVGFVSLAATVTHEKWLTPAKPVPFKITTKTLDGVGQTATGQLIVRKLTPPEKLQRKSIAPNYGRPRMSKTDTPDLSDYRRWPVGDIVKQAEVTTDEDGAAEEKFELGAGAFQVTFETTDTGGEKVSAVSNFLVVDPDAKAFPVKVADYFAAQKSKWQPGETFSAVWGTGYETGRAYVEVFHRDQQVAAFWTDADSTQRKIEFPIEEKHRGGLQLVVNYVRENRHYYHPIRIEVPWENKKLQVKWNHFVSKLEPGGKETWTAVVSGEDAQSKAIEMVAAMYDSSLDQFSPHQWQAVLGNFYSDNLNRHYQFSNRQLNLGRLGNFQGGLTRSASMRHRRFANAIGLPRTIQPRTRMMRGRQAMPYGAPDPATASAGITAFGDSNDAVEGFAMKGEMEATESDATMDFEGKSGENADQSGGGEATEPDLSQVAIRKNLQETAFFYPNLIADADGQVKIEFEVPEALTTWKFMGLAHDGELRTGLLTDEMTTSKDLMVQPNPPRFLREGDQLYFSVKVTNLSDEAQTGIVQLQLNNAFDEEPVDKAFGNGESKKTFEVPAKESRSYHWKLAVPDFVGALTYKVVGASESVSDGEEGLLPVLSKRILVTESLPLPIRGNQTRKFTFKALEKMDRSDSLKNETLTIQMTSNPSWYAVMALPYLMEYPHQCSEQTFNRLYANALGQKIVNSNPRIEKIFDQWRGTDALKSPLEKNDELRNVMIAESPWLLAGKNESQARRNVGLLFESNRINREIKKALDRMAEMQLPDGAWPWFAGGRSNHYLTLYITTGFGRLRNLGVNIDVQTAIGALEFLDAKMAEKYRRLKENNHLDRNNFSRTLALYLYGRSFFLKDKAISDNNRPAFDYFVGQAKAHWGKLGSRQSQAHVAIAMKRLNDLPTAQAIMKSLTERSQRDDELGQYWAESENAWFWYQAPIETQAMLIEAYDEVMGDAESVEECKIWLLKQKQTQAWKTTKATADAVYALLLRGSDRLASTKLVGVTWGGERVQPAEVEVGTGFFEQKITGGDIKSSQKEIAVVKTDDGIAWGSIHWQYLEDVSKIEPYEGTPLTVKKSLFIKKNTDNGPEISAVNGPVEIGDELVTRVEIRVDRDMEFVHLKDYRGSGTEPVNVLSRYKMQDGLWYYESTRDTASHFFIEYLAKGTYVFESSVRVQHGGNYQTGIAEVQCMYAPEFNSHSNSVAIEVKPAE